MKTLLDRAALRLSRAGVKRWEIYVEDRHDSECEVIDGAINLLRRARQRSLGIRILDGGLGHVGLLEPDDAGIEDGIRIALAEARLARPEILEDFCGPTTPVIGAPFLDPRADGRLRPALEERTLALEAEALGADPRIVAVRPAAISEVIGAWHMRTSAGLEAEEMTSRAFLGVGAVAEDDDDSRLAFEETSAGSIEALDLTVARRAAQRATSLLGAKPPPTGRCPIVLSATAAMVLWECLVEAMEGPKLERGASFLAGRVGDRVVAEVLSITDAPHDGALDGACWRDGEGLHTQATPLLERGHFRHVLHDRASAARAGVGPRGTSQRSSTGRPWPGAHNLIVASGPHAFDALLHLAEGGLYVDELLGAHTINAITGEISLGATGWRVRQGALAEPFEGATIAGTLLSLLEHLVLGREAHVAGRTRTPLALLPAVSVASSS